MILIWYQIGDNTTKETLHTYVSRGFTADDAAAGTLLVNVKFPLPHVEPLAICPGGTASQF